VDEPRRTGRPNSAVTGRSVRASVAVAGGGSNSARTNGVRYEEDDAPPNLQKAFARSITETLSAADGQGGGIRELNAERPGSGNRGTRNLRPSNQVNEFTNLVERTVDALKGNNDNGAYEDAQRILAGIRKQYDEVHAEAEKKELELVDIRKEVRLVETDDRTDARHPENMTSSGVNREWITARVTEVSTKIEESATTKRVYSHMVTRLKHEQMIVQQKIGSMEEHLNRKTREVEKRQEMSRRVHGEKVQSLIEMEAMETDMEQERLVCNAALDDLEVVLQQRRNEVRRREDFERWRYEVAMEAASEAFHAMAGRFRKIYAIEKLTGNCLQKIIFEQAEQSQATEDGFQKIREVTGLTDVMDIVHKFLNRDVEHEQLRVSVREAEAHLTRLHGLREAEMNKHSEGMGSDTGKGMAVRPRGLNTEVADQEQQLHKAQRDHEEYQLRLRNMTLLVDNIMQWARRMIKSLSSFEELDELESPQDLVPFFHSLRQTVERFFTQANEEMSASKLSKLASQAGIKEYTEQQKLLADKEFIRANCRVPASLDAQRPHSAGRPGHGHHGHSHGHRGGRDQDEDRDEANQVGMSEDRERLKKESLASFQEKDLQSRTNRSLEQQIRRLQGEGRGEHRTEDSHAGVASDEFARARTASAENAGRRNAPAAAPPSRPNSRAGNGRPRGATQASMSAR